MPVNADTATMGANQTSKHLIKISMAADEPLSQDKKIAINLSKAIAKQKQKQKSRMAPFLAGKPIQLLGKRKAARAQEIETAGSRDCSRE